MFCIVGSMNLAEAGPRPSMKESEPQYDDADVEITNLDTGEQKPSRVSTAARLAPQLRAWAGRRRRPLSAASAVLVVLAVLLILASSTSIRGLVAREIPTPAPTPTLLPGLDLFYVNATPPWGHLWVDGHAIALVPAPGIDVPLRLSRGKHLFSWRAAPFHDMQCTISVPQNYASDTCRANTQSYLSGVFVSIVMLNDMLNNLPVEQQVALIGATQHALDGQHSSDIVQPGEEYVLATQYAPCRPALNEPSCYGVAKEPLRATLRYQLDTNPKSVEGCIGPEPNCTFLSQNCRLFCPGIADTQAPQWMAFIPALSLWTFTTLEGRILEQDVPDNLIWDVVSRQAEDESLIAVQITWDSGEWHVTVPRNAQIGFLNPACATADTGVQMLQPPVDVKGETIPLQWQFASSANPAAGCVGIGTPNPQLLVDITPVAFPAPYSLHRFGVVLAANAAAHQLWPQLPLVDAHEQQLAARLVNLLGGP